MRPWRRWRTMGADGSPSSNRSGCDVAGRLGRCCGFQSFAIRRLHANLRLRPHKLARQGEAMKEYKVMSQKDKWFGGKFDPESLEKGINAYASQGWRVISVATASIPGLTGMREEMIVVLERDA